MAIVYVRRNENIESALKRFNKEVHDEGIIQEIKRRSRYIKPSEKKRMKVLEKKKLLAKLRRKEREFKDKE